MERDSKISPDRLKWAYAFGDLSRYLLMASLVLLFLSALGFLLNKWNVLGDIYGNDLTAVLFHWAVYGAFYWIIFISLPAVLALLALHVLLKRRGILLKISTHLLLAALHFVLLLPLVILALLG